MLKLSARSYFNSLEKMEFLLKLSLGIWSKQRKFSFLPLVKFCLLLQNNAQICLFIKYFLKEKAVKYNLVTPFSEATQRQKSHLSLYLLMINLSQFQLLTAPHTSFTSKNLKNQNFEMCFRTKFHKTELIQNM